MYLWFSLLSMSCPGFRSSQQPSKQINKFSSQIKQGFFLRVPTLDLFSVYKVFSKNVQSKEGAQFCVASSKSHFAKLSYKVKYFYHNQMPSFL